MATLSTIFSAARPFSPLVTCHVSSLALPAQHSSPPQLPEPLNLATNPNSLNCALNCKHFQSCSGCTHEFNLHRPVILNEATDFFKNHGVDDFTFDSCRLYGWRCRAKLAVRGSSVSPLIGLYEEGTHNVVDIPDCQAHHPNINAAVQLLKQALLGIAQFDIEPYDEDERTGELRYVQMAVTTHSTNLPFSERYKNGRVQVSLVWNSRSEDSPGKVQVSLVWNSRSEDSPGAEKLNSLAKFLWARGGPRSSIHLIHSVWSNFQTSSNNIIFGNRWRHLFGERDFWEHVGGIDISLDPSSFGQANTRAFDSLLKKLHKYVPYGSSVTDLYAGAGVIGLSLTVSRKCRSVKCIEINKEAKISFEKTVARLANSVDSRISWHHADTSTEPLSWLVGTDVAVVDPPRKGLDESVVDVLRNISSAERKVNRSENSMFSQKKDEKRPWILRSREESVKVESKTTWEETQSLPQTLIYISCGWESFKEDCKSLLSSKAWHLEKAHGFNFFPGTQSIEVLAIFKRGPGASKKKAIKKKKKIIVRT